MITGLSLTFINRDVRGRQEAEVALSLAHSNLEARVRDRTIDLARANEELLRTRAELETRVRERTADLARANEELHETSTLQQAILNSANYSIVSTDADGIIHTFNAAAQRWLGYAPCELVGRETPLILHDPKELAARQAELSEDLGLPLEEGFEVLVTRARYGEPEEREWTYVRKDGTGFPVLLSVTALSDEAGRRVRIPGDRQRHHGAEASRGAAAARHGHRRGRQPCQERIPRQHEPRAAHAAQLGHRLHQHPPQEQGS